MAQLNGVVINQLEDGLGRRSDNTDRVMVLVCAMPLATLNLEANTAVKLIQLQDAEALGIDAAFDANNEVLAHHHVSEIFRLDPSATNYIIGVEAGENGILIKNAIAGILPTVRANKEIKGFGFVGFNDTIVTLADDIDTIQADLVEVLKGENRFIDFVLLEGKGTATAINPATIVDMRTKSAPQCSVVIAQDPAIAGIDEAYKYYAAVGSAMGMLSVRRINENIGSVDIKVKPRLKKGNADYPLTDSANGLWLTTNLCDGTVTETLSKVQLKALNDKGYIYAASYEGYAGTYFSNSPTAVTKTSDFAYIENNCVWNKAARLLRTALIPVVKSTVKKDPSTGFIKSSTVSYWQSLGLKVLERMQADDEISGYDFYIDPRQVVNDESPVKAKAQVVADGIVHEFSVDLGLTNQIS